MSKMKRPYNASVIENLESRRHLSAVISSVTFGGTTSAPVVTIKGIGFGAKPKALKSTTYPLGTGADYAKDKFLFRDLSQTPLTWTAGITGNLIGLTVSKYSNKLVTYGFGTGLAEELGNYSFNVGDSFEVGVNGATAFGTVALDGSNTIPVAANVTATASKSKIPMSLASGAKLTGSFLLTLTNSGNLAAAGPQSITVYAAATAADLEAGSGVPLRTLTHASPLAAGSVHKIAIKLTGTAPPIGQYIVTAVVTPPGGTPVVAEVAFLTVT